MLENHIDADFISCEQLSLWARGCGRFAFAPAALERLHADRQVVQRYADARTPVYGLNTGLGVLNLLPLPMLDGGHLMYYLWEAVTGRAVSDAWLARLQRTGLVILLLMMSVAVFNDLHRLLS